MEAVVSGIESKMFSSELSAKASAASINELTVQSEVAFKGIRFNITAGRDDTAKLRSDVKDWTIKADESSKDLLTTLF